MNAAPLRDLGACHEAVRWVEAQPDAATAWATCPRGDWLLWLLAKLAGPWGSESHRRVAFLAALCASQAWQWMSPVGRAAIELAIRYGQGAPISRDELLKARRAAAGAAYADVVGAYGAAYVGAYGAAYAAAAYAAAYAAAAYAAAAYADAAAAAYADAYAADADRARVLRESADLVRLAYPEPRVLGAKERAA